MAGSALQALLSHDLLGFPGLWGLSVRGSHGCFSREDKTRLLCLSRWGRAGFLVWGGGVQGFAGDSAVT